MSVEFAILAPVMILFLLVVIYAGRYSVASDAVEAAAYEAARTASIERDPTTAKIQGTAASSYTLADQGLACQTSHVDIDVSGFNAPIGTTAVVTATVTCVLDLSDLSIPGAPGTRTITMTATSPIDTYRSGS